MPIGKDSKEVSLTPNQNLRISKRISGDRELHNKEVAGLNQFFRRPRQLPVAITFDPELRLTHGLRLHEALVALFTIITHAKHGYHVLLSHFSLSILLNSLSLTTSSFFEFLDRCIYQVLEKWWWRRPNWSKGTVNWCLDTRWREGNRVLALSLASRLYMRWQLRDGMRPEGRDDVMNGIEMGGFERKGLRTIF
ncbi:hypothetical protein PIB30_078892 [Stylosanthes scabra]|uniref:Uncharacterized protein n=1 Tax=Stylosanthes scabra TaxID=79078 RepID=A0ABU6RR13_9FABA|nr:hypothetical protein [Stylosanthes scabra]